MNHAEFHAAVVAVAAGKYCATKVEALTCSTGDVRVAWSAYIDGRSWSRDYGTPEGALRELNGAPPDTGIDGIGDAPVANAGATL